MSNTVTSYILVHDGGKLTVEDVNLAVHAVHPLPTHSSGEENYYSARLSMNSEWIKVRTKWSVHREGITNNLLPICWTRSTTSHFRVSD